MAVDPVKRGMKEQGRTVFRREHTVPGVDENHYGVWPTKAQGLQLLQQHK